MNKTQRRPIIAGNWKMNNTRAQTRELIGAIRPLVAGADCEVVVCAPFTALETALDAVGDSGIAVAAQNCHWEKSGAFTAEVSAQMLTELGVTHVIIGHSERRQYFGETDETVRRRVRAALDAQLVVILCVGELLWQREGDITGEICAMQVKLALQGVTAAEMARVVIAYEPVWAIGTGKTATAQQAGDTCRLIRSVVAGLYGRQTADALRVQYGGSMNAKNAAELLAQPDVDGGLIGGAALKAEEFAAIVKAAG